MKFVEIENISIYHKNRICDVETLFKHDVHERLDDELINMFDLNENDVIEICDFQFDVDFHERDH